FTAGRGHVMTSLLRCDGLDVKDDSATVALRAEKTCEDLVGAELGGEERFGDRADRPAANLEAHFANAADLGDLRFVAEAHVEGREAGRREPERSTLDDLRRQRQPIGHADASCGARRDSSRSTAFIITEGVVSAWSVTTVRWRSTASLKRKPVSSSFNTLLSHSMLMHR